MNKGKLIVIEGACDGIGKSTQYNKLYKYLKKENNVIKHHFPSYNTMQGAGVENYLRGKYGKINNLSPFFVNNLYAYDRMITWNEKLKKAYDKGNIILLDRYTTSSLIYQSALIDDIDEKKKFIDYVCDFEYNKLGIKKPDLILFLTADFNVVTNLRNNRIDNEGIVNDIHEKDIEFMKKVYDNAIFISNYLNWDIINCSYNNKMLSIDEIHNDIVKKLKKTL